MRENMGLYRGKRKDNGEWVEGYYFERKDTRGNIIESVIIVDAYEQITNGQRYIRSNLNHECFRVAPETVGQFIGMADKNGNRIFDGDIVDAIWSDHIGNTKNNLLVADMSDPVKMFNLDFSNEIKVIGNIHDNPELLEVKGP